MKTIELRNPDNALYLSAVNWHKDEELNLATGMGRGNPGVVKARLLLNDLCTMSSPNCGLFGVYNSNPEPVGYIVLDNVDNIRKSADIHLTIAPEFQGKGYGSAAMTELIDRAFKSGLYRLQFAPFQNNKPAIQMAKKLGFKIEAVMRASAWMDGSPRNQTLMRLTKPEWKKG